jgi:hypothetical protein
MSAFNVKAKKLDTEDQLGTIRAFEKELGVVIVAYEPQLHLATLSDEQIERLREMERELSAVLVAFEPHSAYLSAKG